MLRSAQTGDVRASRSRPTGNGVSALGDRLVSATLIQHMKDEALTQLTKWHQANPFETGMPASTLRQGLGGPVAGDLVESLVGHGAIERLEALVRLPGFRPKSRGSQVEIDRIVAKLEKEGLSAPSVTELGREVGRPDMAAVLRPAVQSGRLVVRRGGGAGGFCEGAEGGRSGGFHHAGITPRPDGPHPQVPDTAAGMGRPGGPYPPGGGGPNSGHSALTLAPLARGRSF